MGNGRQDKGDRRELMQRPEIPFEPWPKISRYNRTITVTEKVDGTNSAVYIPNDGLTIHAASRTRWITPEDDNYGFARWVSEHTEELLKLGPGYHFGEWWGAGIQRNYGLKEKRFSLFNTSRWSDPESRPACCGVVPVLTSGPICDIDVRAILNRLRESGSVAAPGWMSPEGVVVYHSASRTLYKMTLDNQDAHKELA